MTIHEILAIIQGNKWYYIAALTIIPTVVTVIGNVIIDKIRGDKGKGKKALVSTVLARRKILCKRFSTKSRISRFKCA